MKTRKLRDLEVSAIGYGCMSLSMGYGATPAKDESIQLILNAYEQGCTFFDTADMYGFGTNEELVASAFKGIRDKVVIATKFLFQKDWEGNSKERLMQTLRGRLENSLKRLNTDHIDLYYQHRVNKDIPVEDIAWCMGEFIKEGKILGWGQSEATVEEIKCAHIVTPLTAVQSNFSFIDRQYEENVLPICKELGIGFVAYSPLAGGLLSGKVKANTVYTGFDSRRVAPRFEKENVLANQPLIDLLKQVADQKNATPAQISLAWMLHKYEFLVPIPSARTKERIIENLGAEDIELTNDELEKIEGELSKIQIHGKRTTDENMAKLRSILVEESKQIG